MGHGKKNKALHVGPNMTPMVDIVMCILIFFMLGSSFAMQELYLANVPAVNTGGLGDAKTDAKLPAIKARIVMRRVGETTKVIAFDHAMEGIDDLYPAGGGRSKIDDIRDLLLDRQPKMNKDVQVIVAPEANVPYQDVVTMYSLLIKAKFENVAFAALK
ncbi:MAG: biopolymer transporter ExbD [Phycisphaerae bacterium]